MSETWAEWRARTTGADSERRLQAFGIDLGVKMCRRLLDAGTPGVHMYTLNLEQAAVGILEALGLINKKQVGLRDALKAMPAKIMPRQKCSAWHQRPCANGPLLSHALQGGGWESLPLRLGTFVFLHVCLQ